MNSPVGWADFELVLFAIFGIQQAQLDSFQVQTDDFSKNSTFGPKRQEVQLFRFLISKKLESKKLLKNTVSQEDN